MANSNKYNPLQHEKDKLLYEVSGICPRCNKSLYERTAKTNRKKFECAHIYPEHPTPKEVELLKNEERLSKDVNDINNLIALCPNCHQEFDNPRTVEKYRDMFQLKKQFSEKAKMRNFYHTFNIEDEIRAVLIKLVELNKENHLEKLNLEVISVKTKISSNDMVPIEINKIIYDVAEYYHFIQKCFQDIDNEHSNKFNLIASEIKTFYLKCVSENLEKLDTYKQIIEWLYVKNNHNNREACAIIVAFFIQNCEVF